MCDNFYMEYKSIKTRPNIIGTIGALLGLAIVLGAMIFSGYQLAIGGIDSANKYIEIANNVVSWEEEVEGIQEEIDNTVDELGGMVEQLVDLNSELAYLLNEISAGMPVDESDLDGITNAISEIENGIKAIIGEQFYQDITNGADVGLEDLEGSLGNLINYSEKLYKNIEVELEKGVSVTKDLGILIAWSAPILVVGIFYLIFLLFFITTYRWKTFVGVISLLLGIIPGLMILMSNVSEKYKSKIDRMALKTAKQHEALKELEINQQIKQNNAVHDVNKVAN